MSQKHIRKKTAPKDPAEKKAGFKLSASKKSSNIPDVLNSTVVIRIVIASVIFAVSLIISMPEFLRIILMMIATVAAGYDIVLKAVSEVENGNFISPPVLTVIIAVTAFFIGFSIEGTALIILYQIGTLLLEYAKERTVKAALGLLDVQDSSVIFKMKELIKNPDNTRTGTYDVMLKSSGSILKIAIVFAVIYAVTLPIFTNFPMKVSVHRALMIVLISTPMSVVVSIPLAAIMGMCYSAQQGVMFSHAEALESLTDISTAIFDKRGIFSDESPKVVALSSDLMDSETFLNFVAHSVYYSEEPLAEAVSDIFDNDYNLDVIKDFKDIPGYGVSLSINSIPVALATKEYFDAKGIPVEADNRPGCQTYYMVVAGKAMGKLVVSSKANESVSELVPEMKSVGFTRCVMLTEDSRETAEQFAEMMNFSELYPQCDTEKKLRIINEVSKKNKGSLLYVYASGIDGHSAAGVDMRVSKSAKYADAVVFPEYINNIPFAKQVAVRVKEISTENALFAFIVKAVLIFLSIIGYCNLWFALFIDFVAAIATILNTIRVTNESLIRTLKYKTGR